MAEDPESMDRLADRVRSALASGDVAAFAGLLDPKVRWGPPRDPSPPCQSREQVLAWYQRGRKAGMTADITSVEVVGGSILVGLVVRGSPAARERGGQTLRWQVLTVSHGAVAEIVGFATRAEAVAHADDAAVSEVI